MRILSRYIASKYKSLCQNNLESLVLNNVRTWCDKPVPLTSWKVLFYGTDDFSVESLKSIYQNWIAGNPPLIQHLEVVTAPLKNTPLAVRQFAMKNNVPLHDWPYCPPKNKFDVGVVVSFGYLIPKEIIESFELGMLNVHASLLPRWRGAAPIFHAILNGDLESGVTLMQVEADRFDVGKILAQRHYLLPYRVTSSSMKSDLAKLGSEMLINSFENLNQLILNAKLQDPSLATKAPKIKPDIAIIKWQEHTCKYIDRLYRALSDTTKLETTCLGRTVKLFDMLEPKDMAEINCVQIKQELKSKSDVIPGKVFFHKRRKVLLVLCKDGWVGFRSVSYKGKKQMSAGDFYNGFLSKVDHHQNYFT